MRWVWQILVDAGSLAAFTILVIKGHPYASVVPAIALLTFQIRDRRPATPNAAESKKQ
jgi:hypothetical protein